MAPGEDGTLIYGTCVALGRRAVLLRGPSGAGKSDLALRFLSLPADDHGAPLLVSDDQLLVRAEAGQLKVSPPATIAGRIEVRGIGIVPVPYAATADLVLIADLASPGEVSRMPKSPLETEAIAGVTLPRLLLAPFESSAALKLKMALLLETVRSHIQNS